MESPSANKKWQPETVKHLVSLYELQPLLYNVNSPLYHNKMSRNVAVETIAQELIKTTKIKFTNDEVLKKLNSIRTQFLNVERSRKKGEPSGSGSSSTSKPSWWLYDSLQFLLPFTKKDSSDTNLVVHKSLESVTLPDNISAIEQNEEVYSFSFSPNEILTPDPSRANSPTSFASQEENLSSRPQKRKRSEKVGTENILRETLDKIAEEKEDPIDLFTSWLGSELKSIKDENIIKRLKRKIVSVLQEAQDEDDDLIINGR